MFESNFACRNEKLRKRMDCIFNATFFQPLFLKRKKEMFKKKTTKKARQRLCGCGPRLWGVEVDTFSSSALHSRDILPPPAFWVSSFNTLNLQAECTSLEKEKYYIKIRSCSLIKQNVLKIHKLPRALLLWMLCQQVFIRWKIVGGWSGCVCVCAPLTTLSRRCAVMT